MDKTEKDKPVIKTTDGSGGSAYNEPVRTDRPYYKQQRKSVHTWTNDSRKKKKKPVTRKNRPVKKGPRR